MNSNGMVNARRSKRWRCINAHAGGAESFVALIAAILGISTDLPGITQYLLVDFGYPFSVLTG